MAFFRFWDSRSGSRPESGVTIQFVSGQVEAEKLSSLLLANLDQLGSAVELARQAFHSRSGYFRLFQAVIQESPGAMRRRFLLERAAWQLRETQLPVTEVAFDAQYTSLEAFTRAFSRAYRVSPSLFRRTGVRAIHLPAPNPFHFRPPTRPDRQGAPTMDLFDIFAGTDSWHTRRLLENALPLTGEQLDRPTNISARLYAWDSPDANLRQILERIVETKEVWNAALTGGPMPTPGKSPESERTPEALLERFDKADAEFRRVFERIRDRGEWNATFVDELCEPPETFSYGGVFGSIIMDNTYRRMTALDAFTRLGIHIPGSGCPIEYWNTISQTVK